MFSCLLLDMHTAHMVERVLHALGPGLREFKFDCYRGRTHASDGLSCALTGLRHCTRLSSLCLEGNHCLRALSRANKVRARWLESACLHHPHPRACHLGVLS